MFNRKQTAFPDPLSFIVPYTPDVEVVHKDAAQWLRWQETADSVHIYTSTNPDQIDTFYKTITETTEANISDLDRKQRYYFRLHFEGGVWDGRRLIVAERVLPVGVVNFRDVGGYETKDGRFTKWGKLYRSGALLNLDEPDLAYLQQLAITAVCDLRSEEESDKNPDQLPPKHVSYHKLPVLDLARWTKWRGLFAVLFKREKLHDFMIEGYTKVMIDDNPQVVRHIFERGRQRQMDCLCWFIAQRVKIVLAQLWPYFCTVWACLLETILADYTLSNHYYAQFKTLIEPDIAGLRRVGIYADDLHAVLIVRRTLIESMFAYIDAGYGSFDNYLKTHVGIDDTILERIFE